MPMDLYEQLAEISKKEARSVSGQLIYIVSKFIEEQSSG